MASGHISKGIASDRNLIKTLNADSNSLFLCICSMNIKAPFKEDHDVQEEKTLRKHAVVICIPSFGFFWPIIKSIQLKCLCKRKK